MAFNDMRAFSPEWHLMAVHSKGVLNDRRFAIDQWSSSFAPRHSAQAPSALGLASVQRVQRAHAILLRPSPIPPLS
jgi:hypothetical protein